MPDVNQAQRAIAVLASHGRVIKREDVRTREREHRLDTVCGGRGNGLNASVSADGVGF